ncbi:MAG: hybrid sensor histidine kinase/response regulator, partial [Muribaculaceae bacterium]|nr:hybrid sensor histidine kinase/response regulator [Muribaculaceae bacterium]
MSRCVTDLLLSLALLWAAVVPCLAAAPGNIVNGFQPRMIGTSDGLPSDNVQQVFQDSEGYMWFATRNGLSRYDGFGMEVFKSDIRNGDLLTNNSITCLAEDSMNRVWIGTPDGLNMLDKRTARLKKIRPRALYNNPVSAIIATRCGRVLLGTDQGLYEYFPERDSCALVTRQMTGDVMPQT